MSTDAAAPWNTRGIPDPSTPTAGSWMPPPARWSGRCSRAPCRRPAATASPTSTWTCPQAPTKSISPTTPTPSAASSPAGSATSTAGSSPGNVRPSGRVSWASPRRGFGRPGPRRPSSSGWRSTMRLPTPAPWPPSRRRWPGGAKWSPCGPAATGNSSPRPSAAPALSPSRCTRRARGNPAGVSMTRAGSWMPAPASGCGAWTGPSPAGGEAPARTCG